MTEREKIIEIIAPFVSAYGEDEAIADALIEAEIGDVTKWKERAEKAEKEVSALNERAKRFKIVVPMGTTVNSFGSELYRTQPNPYGVKQLYSDEEVEDIARQRNEYKHRAEVYERALYHTAISDTEYQEAIEQAQKELAEEGCL